MRDNYNFSVGCIVRKKNRILLVRHTYGGAKGKLLIPGGFCHENELPEETAVREVYEEGQFVIMPLVFVSIIEKQFPPCPVKQL